MMLMAVSEADVGRSDAVGEIINHSNVVIPGHTSLVTSR